jgi:hypothetical protein
MINLLFYRTDAFSFCPEERFVALSGMINICDGFLIRRSGGFSGR